MEGRLVLILVMKLVPLFWGGKERGAGNSGGSYSLHRLPSQDYLRAGKGGEAGLLGSSDLLWQIGIKNPVRVRKLRYRVSRRVRCIR
jgi:hypothetical protein